MDSESCITPPHNTPIVSTLRSDPDMRELIDLFVSELGTRVVKIQESISAQDLRQLHTCAHQLKGSAGGYGFAPISEAAARLEQAINQDDPSFDLASIAREAEALVVICQRVQA